MAVKRWQYQIKADVVFIEEGITLDKWFTQVSEPIKPAGNHNHITVGFFDFSGLSWPEQVLLDKWFVKTSEPVLPKFRSYYYPFLDFRTELAIAAETITVDKWFNPLSEPVLPRFKPYYYPNGDFRWLQWQETILLDKWFVKTSEPVRPRFKPYYYPQIDYRTELDVLVNFRTFNKASTTFRPYSPSISNVGLGITTWDSVLTRWDVVGGKEYTIWDGTWNTNIKRMNKAITTFRKLKNV